MTWDQCEYVYMCLMSPMLLPMPLLIVYPSIPHDLLIPGAPKKKRRKEVSGIYMQMNVKSCLSLYKQLCRVGTRKSEGERDTPMTVPQKLPFDLFTGFTYAFQSFQYACAFMLHTFCCCYTLFIFSTLPSLASSGRLMLTRCAPLGRWNFAPAAL